MKHVPIPDRGGERPRLPSAQVGPVTQAIRAMRAADPSKLGHVSPTFDCGTFIHAIRALSRTEVEDLVGGLIDLLDAWDGDTDIEQDASEMPQGDDEREGDPADDGIGDYDGLAEQVGLALSLRAYA